MPTRKQMQVLQIIENFIEEKKYSPTIREVSKAIGHKSPSTVYEMLKKMKKLGLIDWEPDRPRTLTVKKGA